MKIAFIALAGAIAVTPPAWAQSCETRVYGNTAYTDCYSGGGFGWGDLIALQIHRQAVINRGRQAHGLPKCSAFPIFHWDGLPGC